MILFNFNMEVVGEGDLTDEQMEQIKDDLFALMQKYNMNMVNLGVYDLVDEEGKQVEVPAIDLPTAENSIHLTDKANSDVVMAVISKALSDAGFTVKDAPSEPESDVDYHYPQTSKRLN